MSPFMGSQNATVGLNVSAASQRVQVQAQVQCAAVRVVNDGTATVFIEFGDGTVTATIPDTTTPGAAAGSIPVGSGVETVLRLPSTHVAVIAAAATGNVYFTPGEGI